MQELLFSRICESTTGYTFTPCVGSFTSPGIDTRQKGPPAFSVSSERRRQMWDERSCLRFKTAAGGMGLSHCPLEWQSGAGVPGDLLTTTLSHTSNICDHLTCSCHVFFQKWEASSPTKVEWIGWKCRQTKLLGQIWAWRWCTKVGNKDSTYKLLGQIWAWRWCTKVGNKDSTYKPSVNFLCTLYDETYYFIDFFVNVALLYMFVCDKL